jgi:hypothetical protein
VQRKRIAELNGFRMWADADLPTLRDKGRLLARTDVSPAFLLAELMVFLIGHRIVRPGYSTLQTIISDALTAERVRLEQLIDAALTESTRQLEDETKAVANKQAAQIHNERQQATPRVGELLLLYVDDTLDDVTPSGKVRRRAFRIMPEAALRSTGKLLTETPVSQMGLRWQAVDKHSGLCTKNLRPLAMQSQIAAMFKGTTINVNGQDVRVSGILEMLRTLQSEGGAASLNIVVGGQSGAGPTVDALLSALKDGLPRETAGTLGVSDAARKGLGDDYSSTNVTVLKVTPTA